VEENTRTRTFEALSMKLCSLLLVLALVVLPAPPYASAAPPMLQLVVQTGHFFDVGAVALSGDGKYALTGSSDGTAILWDAAGNRLRGFKGHDYAVLAVALSGDGKRVLTGSGDRTAVLWDAVSGARLQTFKGHSGGVVAVALSGDGKRVLTGSWDQTAILWDVATGKRLHTFTPRHGNVLAVALSADGKYALTGSVERVAVLREAGSGARLRALRGHTDAVTAVAFGPAGRSLLTASADGTAILWDVRTGRTVHVLKGHTGEVRAAALSRDGSCVLTGSNDGTVILWDAATGRKLHTFRVAGRTPPPRSPPRPYEIVRRPRGGVAAVALNADGSRVLTAARDVPTAVLWDRHGRRLTAFTGHTHSVFSVALSGDGRRLLVGSRDRTALLWDLTLGGARALEGHADWVTSVALSGDGRRGVTASRDRTAIFWDLDRRVRLRTFRGVDELAALSADGRRLLTRSASEAVLWDATDSTRLRSFKGHGGYVWSLALSGDGRRVLIAGDEGRATLWDGERGSKIRIFQSPDRSSIGALTLSADGKQVLLGSFTSTLWDAASGARLQSFARHRYGINSVALSADGRRAFTASQDRTAVLWDVTSGARLRTFKGHDSTVGAVTPTPDGRHVLTGSLDGTVRLWDSATGNELCRVISLDGGKDWLVVTPDGLFDGSVNAPQFLSYRIAGTLDFVPLDRFLHRYYTPGLLAQLLKGKRPRARVDVARALPPRVRLVAPTSGREVADGKLEVRAEAHSRGDYPVTAFHLLLDGRPYQGLKAVVRVATPKPGKAEAVWKVELEPGRHTLKVLADTALVRGVPSQEVTVRYVGGAAARVELPRLFVLAIGISRHKDRTLDLDYAAGDARAMAAAYRKHAGKLFRTIEVKVLPDKRATRRGILQGLIWLREQVKPGDYAVFFFAGHGKKDSDGALYFLPTEGDVRDLAGTGISADDLKRHLNSIPGRLTAILDACHSGGIGAGKTRGPHGLTDDLLRDLIAEESGLVVMCSATGNEDAHESHAHKHGVFTVALLEGLAGSASKTKDGAVYLTALDAYVTKRVKELSKNQQHPVTGKPTSLRDFPVSKP
jgi:WD40 repeat protein